MFFSIIEFLLGKFKTVKGGDMFEQNFPQNHFIPNAQFHLLF